MLTMECDKYLTELCGKISDLAQTIHKDNAWVRYESLIGEVENELKKHNDCAALKDAYDALTKELHRIRENGLEDTEEALLDISNEIIQTLI